MLRTGPILASHYVLTKTVGPKPGNLEALHSCDNKGCVNPGHLRWGTRSENMREKFDRLPVKKRTTEPCVTCGRLHRDHESSERAARWYRENQQRVR